MTANRTRTHESGNGRTHWAWLCGLAFLVGWLSLALSHTWADGTYYSYGWLMPAAAGWCGWLQWRRSGGGATGLSPGVHPRTASALILFFAVAAFWIRVLEGVDISWRLALWMHALLVFGTAHVLLGLRLGWRRSAGFLPITILGMMAVPMPSAVENRLVGGMTDWVTEAAVFGMRWLGHPVVPAGTTLIGTEGTVEVGKACSGIRSFQSMIVAAWFFGELLWCAWPARLLLLGLGVSVAFLTNTLRAIALAWLQFEHGAEAMDRWHDPIGWSAFGVAAMVLIAAARALERPEPDGTAVAVTASARPAVASRGTAGLQAAAIGVMAAAIVAEAAAWSWFRFRGGADDAGRALAAASPSLEFPRPAPGRFTPIEFGADPASDILRYDRGGAGIFQSPGDRGQVRLIYLEYREGNPRFWMDLFAHAPEVCMGSVGADLVRVYPERVREIGGQPVHFESLEFLDFHGRRVFIFRGFWVAGTLPEDLGDLRALRLRFAWEGRRPPSGRLFWAAVTEVETESAAWERFETEALERIESKQPE